MRPISSLVRSFLFEVLAIFPLLWVALYNGYPTVYPDTAAYMYSGAFLKAVWPFRAPGYGIFVKDTSLGLSAWFTGVAQAIIVVFVLFELCKYLIDGESKFRDHSLLAIVLALAALTSLPWVTSLLMPDVFAGVVFLSLFLVAFDARLHWIERAALAAISAMGAAAHLSLLPIATLFVAALGLSRIAGWTPRGAPSVKSILPWLVVPLLAAGLWTANLNRKMGIGFKISGSGDEFLMGRLLNDGLAGDFLRENCPAKPFVSCRYLGNLPRTPEQFLFWHPLLHEMDGNGDEIHEIVIGTLKTYPLRFAWNSFKHSLRQLITLRTGDEVRDLALHAVNSNGPVIAEAFPRDYPAYSNSKLIQGRLVGLTRAVAVIDTLAFWLSVAACLAIAWKYRSVAERWNWFVYSSVLFLFLNAAVCATLAGVYDRYQSRVAWIMPLCLATFICRQAAQKHNDSHLRGNL